MKKENWIAVSIVIPVYNVYEWLDQCMESVINQTFSNFEVILVNDGSTDGSDMKCYEWEQKDHRIRVISKENEGPSIARNCGIQNAKGEYLVFIDSDDWIDKTYLEKLYYAETNNDAAIAECNIYRCNNNTGEKTYHVCSGNMGQHYTLEDHMVYGNTAIWKCMFRKSLFENYKIEFPNCHGEAKAIYALLLALGKKIVNVDEGLYYYRRFRQGSLTEIPRINEGDENAIGLKAADILLQGFKDQGLYEEYEKQLQKAVTIGFSDRLSGLFYRRSKKEFFQLAQRYYSYIEERFPETANFHYVTLGGYNLNRIVRHMNVLHNPYGRFNFSSIISIMHPTEESFDYQHKNRYRNIMIHRDIYGQFWEIIEELQPEYIFMDFIEERFDILKYGKGYITKSDAFDEILEDRNYLKIERDSEECFEMWRNSFQNFIKEIKRRIPGCKIIIIENYLSEEVGDINNKEYFDDRDMIRKTNNILKRYYTLAHKLDKTITMVKTSKCEYYYTDREYEYGAVPAHLNEIVNKEIAALIERAMQS